MALRSQPIDSKGKILDAIRRHRPPLTDILGGIASNRQSSSYAELQTRCCPLRTIEYPEAWRLRNRGLELAASSGGEAQTPTILVPLAIACSVDAIADHAFEGAGQAALTVLGGIC